MRAGGGSGRSGRCAAGDCDVGGARRQLERRARAEHGAGAVHEPHRLGAESRDPAADVPANGERQCDGAPRRRRRRPDLGQRRPRLVHPRLGADDALDPARRDRPLAHAALLGQQRADDVLLLRHRARGAAGVRSRRAPGASADRPAARRRHRRHGRSDRDLPRLQRRRLRRARVGHRDVDRHGVRAGPPRARRRAIPVPPARVHAHLRRSSTTWSRWS